MQIKRVLNIEDTAAKYAAVIRALKNCGISNVDRAMTAAEAIEMVETAIADGKPYDLIVSDMYFPKAPGEGESYSGEYVQEQLKERGIQIPTILCSSARVNPPGFVGYIHYFPQRNDLDEDMLEQIELVRNM